MKKLAFIATNIGIYYTFAKKRGQRPREKILGRPSLNGNEFELGRVLVSRSMLVAD